MKKLLTLSAGIPSLLSVFAEKAFAQGAFFGNPEGGSATSIAAVAQGTLGQNVTTLLNYFLGFLGIVAVAFIIYGGVLLITSSGEEEAMTKAKKIITYATIGFVVIALSYTIVTFVTSALS